MEKKKKSDVKSKRLNPSNRKRPTERQHPAISTDRRIKTEGQAHPCPARHVALNRRRSCEGPSPAVEPGALVKQLRDEEPQWPFRGETAVIRPPSHSAGERRPVNHQRGTLGSLRWACLDLGFTVPPPTPTPTPTPTPIPSLFCLGKTSLQTEIHGYIKAS